GEPVRHGLRDRPPAAAVHEEGERVDGNGPHGGLRARRNAVLPGRPAQPHQLHLHEAAVHDVHRPVLHRARPGGDDDRLAHPQEDRLLPDGLMLIVLGGLLLGAAAFVVAETATPPARQRRELLKRAANYGSRPVARPIDRRHSTFGERVLAPIFAGVARFVVRLTPNTTRDTIAQRLLSAGLAQSITPDQLLAAKGLLSGAGIFIGALAAAAVGAKGLILVIRLAAVGFIAPYFFVGTRVTRRRELIQAALPDALDLLAVSVEAGLGFDASVAKLVEYMDGPLVEEFALMLNEMR